MKPQKPTLDPKTLAEMGRMSAGAKAKLQEIMGRPGALERLRSFGADIPEAPRELEHIRTDSVVIGSQDLFRCAVQFAVDSGAIVLRDGEEVIGGRAVAAKNGTFAEIKIGRPLEDPGAVTPEALEEVLATDNTPKPVEAERAFGALNLELDKALDVLSRPKPAEVEAKLAEPTEGK